MEPNRPGATKICVLNVRISVEWNHKTTKLSKSCLGETWWNFIIYKSKSKCLVQNETSSSFQNIEKVGLFVVIPHTILRSNCILDFFPKLEPDRNISNLHLNPAFLDGKKQKTSMKHARVWDRNIKMKRTSSYTTPSSPTFPFLTNTSQIII